MAWSKMITLRLVAVMILAGVALVGALQQDTTPVQASYDVLNQALQGIEINVVPETEAIEVSGVTIELLGVECSQLGVGYIQVKRTVSQALEIVDEIVYERVDLQIEIKSLEVSCKISLCTTVFLLGRNCEGFLILDSNENSQSNVTLKTKVLSEDFSRLPPAVAEEVPQSPREKVKLDGVTFTGQDFLSVGFIDLSGIVVGAINSPGSLRDSVLDPLSAEVDALLGEVSLPLNEFLVNNPISSVPQSNDTSTEAFELDVLNTQAELTRDVDELVDLQNNIISSLLFDEVDGKTVLNVSAILENFGELPPTIAPLVEAVYGLPNSDLDNFDLLEVFDTFVGSGGTNEGLLFETFIENVGTIALTITNFTLSTVPPEDAPTDGLLLQILGSSTVAVPELRIEAFRVHVEFAINLDINTQLLEEDLQFAIQDNGTIDLNVTDLAARVALLLTVGVEDLLDLQVGSLYDFPVDCISAVFQRAFQVTKAKLDASTFVLQLGGFSDGLLILLSDLVNNLVLLNEAILPEFLASQLDGLVLLDSASCPIYPQTTENTQEPCDFDSSIVKVISDVFTAELLTSLLDDFAVPDADGIARVLSEVTELIDLEIPFGDGRKIKADILYIDVGNAVPPYFGQFELFKEESNAPQLLKTIISVSSADAPLALFARVRLQEIDGQGKAVQDSEITVSVSFDELLVSLDILARYSDYAFNSLQFADFVRPNCALSKLDPGGGVQQASGFFRGLKFAILCDRCEDSPVLQEWANVTTLEAASADFEAFLNGVIKDIAETAVNVFDDDVFEETVARYEETCENGEGLIIIDPAEEEPIFRTIALVSVFGVLLGIFTLVSLTCRMGRDPRGKRELPSKSNSDKLESDPQALASTMKDEELKQVPLFRHEMVPCFVRVVIPLLLVANLGFFVVGHLGDVLSIGVAASIAGLPINIESFGSFSVLSTTLELFKAGSYSLAILLFLLSVLWPYVKVVGMAVAWVMPGSWLSFRKRDNIITVLDQLGKWSLVELFFVAYILILLNVAVENPDVSFLPEEEKLWTLELLLSAETSLFSFVSALLLSLFISNVIFVYQKRIKHKAFHDFQGDSTVPDSQKISLLELSYPTFNKKGDLRYNLQVTTCGRVAVVLVMMLCMALLVAATFLPVLEVETIGLARPLIEASGDESTVNLSVASLAAMALSNANALRVYFVVVCCATVVIIPFFQMGILIHMATRKFTLKSAILWQERNGLMSAWCATEVFVLAIVFTVLELEKATRGLVGEQCSFLTPVIEPLLALEVINSRDAAASCFALTSRIDTGLIAFLVLALLTQLVHIGVSGLFKAFIKTRIGRFPNDSSQRMETNRYLSIYQVLEFLGFLELSPGLVLKPNPLQQEDPSSNLQL